MTMLRPLILATSLAVGLTNARPADSIEPRIGFISEVPSRALQPGVSGFTIDGIAVPVTGLLRPVAYPITDGRWLITELDTNKTYLFDARLGTALPLPNVYRIPVSGHGTLLGRVSGEWELFDIDLRSRGLRRLWSARAIEMPRSMAAGSGELVIGFPRLAQDGKTRETWLAFVRPGVAAVEVRVGADEWLVVSPETSGPRVLLMRPNGPLGPVQIGRPDTHRANQTAMVATFDRTTGALRFVGEVAQCLDPVVMGCCDSAWSLPDVRWSDQPAGGDVSPLGGPGRPLRWMNGCDRYALDPATGAFTKVVQEPPARKRAAP